jgi:hypothetical protein
MKLISEEIESVDILTEEKDGKKTLYIQGPFLQAEVVNRNRRCYPIATMCNEVKRYTDAFVSTGRALGELGHPDGPQINLDRVSHKIVELRQEGNNFIGKAQILSTPMGKIAESLLADGVKLGVSSRGMGSIVQRDGVNYVGEDFMLATAADIVADPSAPDAFVNGIMEGKEWVWEGSVLREKKCQEIKESLNITMVDREIYEANKLRLFADFLSNI